MFNTGGDSELVQLEKIGSSTGGRNPIQERRYQELRSQADASDPIKIAQKQQEEALARQKAETAARFAGNKAELTDFNTRFSGAVPTAINESSTKYNVPGLLGQATALNTRVQNLSGNLTGEGAGGYASAGQVDRAINEKYLPRYQTAVSNLNTAAQLAADETKTRLIPYQTEAGLLNDRISREATGYSQEQQRELDTLLSKIQTGLALSAQEQSKMLALAELEQRKYEFEKSISTSKSDQNRYITLGDGTQLYDTQTGQVIASNTKDFKASGGGGTDPLGLF